MIDKANIKELSKIIDRQLNAKGKKKRRGVVKEGAGRPPKYFRASEHEFVRNALLTRIPIEQIAEHLGITHNTFKRHFGLELMQAKIALTGKAVKVVNDKLSEGSLEAAKFVLERIAGWSTKETETPQLSIKIVSYSQDGKEVVQIDSQAQEADTIDIEPQELMNG